MRIQILLLSLFLAGLLEPPPLFHFSGIAMTIPYHFIVSSWTSREEVQKLISAAFEETDHHLNHWNPESEISALNHSTSTDSFPLSPLLEKQLAACQALFLLTEGRFDPAIGKIVDHWKAGQETLTPEDSWEGQSWANLLLAPGSATKMQEDLRVDLGGIAKGSTLDRLGKALQARGVKCALLDWGGEILAIGSHPSRRPWKVAILSPQGAARVEILPLVDQALATSGSYFQEWSCVEGQYTHICDPIQQLPILLSPKRPASVTLLAPSCEVADALATALMTTEDTESALHLAEEWAHHISLEALWVIDGKGEIKTLTLRQ